MKAAFFGSDNLSANHDRYSLLARHLGYGMPQRFSVEKIKDGIIEAILLNETVRTKHLLMIFANRLRSIKKLQIEFVALELYSVSYTAALQEFKHQAKGRNFLRPFLECLKQCVKVLTIRSLLRRWGRRLIVPSEQRALFLEDETKSDLKIEVVRNLPVLSTFDQRDLRVATPAVQGDYATKTLFLAGRINNVDDLRLVCEYANKYGYKLDVASGDEKLALAFQDAYPKVIRFLGLLTHKEILVRMRSCLAGIVLYSDYTINQRLSASSKLFEFLVFSRPVIVSKNQGVEEELKKVPLLEVVLVNELDRIGPLRYREPKLEESLSFDRELNKLTQISHGKTS